MEFTLCKAKHYDDLGQGGKLTYNPKTQEYTCWYNRKRIWTEQADAGLYNFVSKFYDDYGNLIHPLDRIEMLKFHIYKKYEDTCNQL